VIRPCIAKPRGVCSTDVFRLLPVPPSRPTSASPARPLTDLKIPNRQPSSRSKPAGPNPPVKPQHAVVEAPPSAGHPLSGGRSAPRLWSLGEVHAAGRQRRQKVFWGHAARTWVFCTVDQSAGQLGGRLLSPMRNLETAIGICLISADMSVGLGCISPWIWLCSGLRMQNQQHTGLPRRRTGPNTGRYLTDCCWPDAGWHGSSVRIGHNSLETSAIRQCKSSPWARLSHRLSDSRFLTATAMAKAEMRAGPVCISLIDSQESRYSAVAARTAHFRLRHHSRPPCASAGCSLAAGLYVGLGCISLAGRASRGPLESHTMNNPLPVKQCPRCAVSLSNPQNRGTFVQLDSIRCCTIQPRHSTS
jgi:hypothetical protein